MPINPKSVQRREIERLTVELKMIDRYRSAKIKLEQINRRSLILISWPIIFVNLVVPYPLEALPPYKKYRLVTKGVVKMAVLTLNKLGQ